MAGQSDSGSSVDIILDYNTKRYYGEAFRNIMDSNIMGRYSIGRVRVRVGFMVRVRVMVRVAISVKVRIRVWVRFRFMARVRVMAKV